MSAMRNAPRLRRALEDQAGRMLLAPLIYGFLVAGLLSTVVVFVDRLPLLAPALAGFGTALVSWLSARFPTVWLVIRSSGFYLLTQPQGRDDLREKRNRSALGQAMFEHPRPGVAVGYGQSPGSGRFWTRGKRVLALLGSSGFSLLRGGRKDA